MFNLCMPTLTLVSMLAPLMPAGSAGAPGSDCVEDGSAVSVCVDLIVPEDMGLSATAWEDDFFFDDPMGACSITPLGDGVFSACVEVTNNDGDLSGPNGEIQNGFGEGDCIDVTIKAVLVYDWSVSVPGFSWDTKLNQPTRPLGSVEVCPCR